MPRAPMNIVGEDTPASGKVEPPGVGEIAAISVLVGVGVFVTLEVGDCVCVAVGVGEFVGVGELPPISGCVGVGVEL